MRLIHTGLYTKKALRLVKLMINAYHAHNEYFLPEGRSRLEHHLTMGGIFYSFWATMNHGEVVLFIKENGLTSEDIEDLSDFTICKVFALFCKKLRSVQRVSGKHVIMHSWFGDRRGITKKFKVKKSDIQLLIDILDGNDISKYKSSEIMSIKGDGPGPIEHEMYSQCQELKHQIEHRYEDEISNLKGRISFLMDKMSDLNKEKNDKLRKLDKVLVARASDVVKTFKDVVNDIGEHL